MNFFRTVLVASFILLVTAIPAKAGVTLTPGVDLNNNPCDIVSWMDSTGKPRVLWIAKGTPGAFVTRYTYYVKDQLVDARPRENYPPWAFLVLANHWHPENSGSFVTSAGNSSAASSSYLSSVTPKVAFAGRNHLLWQGSFKMRMDPANAMQGFYITIQYFIVNGRDDFTWSVAYDGGDAPEGEIWSDNRSPYGDFDFDGDGSSNEALSGLGWGTLYRFKTLGSHLGKDSSWDYTQPNTIPYIWMWKDTTANDREMGIVQNQPYSEQNSGMECHVGGCGEFTPPPSKGKGMPSNIGCIGYQLNSYAGFTGERFTWGSNYKNAWGLFGNGKGVFENGHGEAFGTYTYDNQYPVNAWSMNVQIGSWSRQGVPQLVADTESIYASKLTATTGTAVTQGPRGPGNFLSPKTKAMPSITYTNPGFDFVERRWRVSCANGAADVTLTVGGTGLDRPTFTFENFPSASAAVALDGKWLTSDAGYFSSYDPTSRVLYVTLAQKLPPGAHRIVTRTMSASK